MNARRDDNFRALMHFEAERARGYYDRSMALTPLIHKPGRSVFVVMLRTYRALLDKIEASDFDVFAQRIRVGRCHKLWLALQALLA